MKHFLKVVLISIIMGLCITFLVSGIQYAAQKPEFNPLSGACGSNPLCDPNPYMKFGLPIPVGYYNDASGNTVVLGFNAEDPELTSEHYMGFIIDVLIYSGLAFVAILIFSKFRVKRP